MLNKGWQREWNSEQRVPYAYSSIGEWAGYDDMQSLTEKVTKMFYKIIRSIIILLKFFFFYLFKANYIIQNKIGGAMFWVILFKTKIHLLNENTLNF
jgi:GH18 family chitinase